jgi:ATP synthase protein I
LKKTNQEVIGLWAAASLGITMVACTAVGLAIGLFLDKHFKTGSVLTILFFALGVAAGIRQVVKELTKNSKR